MLSKTSLTQDLLTYGYVTSVNHLKLKVILPNGFTGSVDPVHISDAYTAKLENLVDSQNNEEQNMENNLQSLFPVGSFIICKVMNPSSNHVKLSLNPKDINQNVFSSQIKSNMILIGSVNSIEDHGYVIDFGIKNISAFLNNMDTEEYIEIFNNGKPLQIGQQLRCLIVLAPSDKQKNKNESRTVKITIDPLTIDTTVMKPSMNLSYTSIQPGLKAEVKIVKALNNSLNVTFQNYEGIIPSIYWDLSNKKFKKDTVIQATVVYVDHKEKLLTFSLLNHYHNPISDLFPKYKEGQNKTGIVQSVNNKIGIYLGLPKGILGIANLQGLSGKGSSSMEEAYTTGSEHKCRVIGFLPVENLVRVSVKSIQTDTQFLTITDMIPGDVVTCKVKDIIGKGVLVSINERLKGLIPKFHVDDDMTKSPEEILGEGDSIKCRILNIDLKSYRIFLTCKKSLVESTSPVVFRFDQIKAEMLLQGYVKFLNDVGIQIAFYGDLTVWLPKKCLNLPPNALPSAEYKIGQVIKCKVSKLIPEEEKFFIVIQDNTKNQKLPVDEVPVPEVQEKSIKTTRKVPAVDIPAPEVGELTRCVIHKRTAKSFSVYLIPSKKSALIPKMHLSDSMEMCEMMWNNYQTNHMLDVIIFEKTKNFIVASCKTSLMKAAKDKSFVSSVQDIEVGQVLVGVVQNVLDYGIFVEFPGHTVGLARNKFITAEDYIVNDYWFKPGMTVCAKVIEVKENKEKFCVTLVMSDVGIDPTYGLKLLQTAFKEKEEFTKILKHIRGQEWLLNNVTVGTICFIKITAVDKNGARCKLENGVKGFITKHHTRGHDLKKGLKIYAIVIDVHPASNSVELCISPQIILDAKKLALNSIPVPKNTQMESIVLLIKADLVLVMLTTEVKGQLAYLCPKIHENDVTSCERFYVNEKLKVEYVQNIGDKVVVQLHPSDVKASQMKALGTKKPKKATKAVSDKENVKKKKKAKSDKSKPVVNDSSTTKKEKKGKKRKAEESNDVIVEKKKRKKKCKEMEKEDDECEMNNKVLDVMPPVFFNWDETPKGQNNKCDDDSEDEMSQDEAVCTNSKMSKAKLKENQEKEEQRLYEIERKRLEGERQLETAEDFDCLVLNSPNSSLLWLRYMAFHLETAEVDKARAVAERALKTISFREEQEKFNIWIGYLNLENLYGPKEKLGKVLERALQQNQAIKVYQQLVNIYVKSGKIQQAEDVHRILMKRFRAEKNVWIHYATFCYKNANLEEGRKLVERAVKSLHKKDHVAIIVKIAQLEFKYGEAERGKTMFENIVSNFPKRTDLWSIYIDMTIQQGDKDAVRNLFERVTNLRLSTQKMKFFFKKYLDFEQKYGTPELVIGVRKKALEYVEDSHEADSGSER